MVGCYPSNSLLWLTNHKVALWISVNPWWDFSLFGFFFFKEKLGRPRFSFLFVSVAVNLNQRLNWQALNLSAVDKSVHSN